MSNPFTFDVLQFLEEVSARLDEPYGLIEERVSDLDAPPEVIEDRIARYESRVRAAKAGSLPSLPYWEEKLANLKTALAAEALVERELKVGQGYDVGTERTWARGTFVKTSKGWVRKSDGKPASKPEPKPKAEKPQKAAGASKPAPKASAGATPAKPAQKPAKAPAGDSGKPEAPPPPPTGVEAAKLKSGKGDSFRGLVRDMRKAFANAVLDKLGNMASAGLAKFLPPDQADELGHRAAQMLGKGLSKMLGGSDMPPPSKAPEPEDDSAQAPEAPEEPKPPKAKKATSSAPVHKQVAKAVDKLRKAASLPDAAHTKPPKGKRTKTKAQKVQADKEIAAHLSKKRTKTPAQKKRADAELEAQFSRR